MSKNIILFFASAVLFSSFNLARADVFINEVQLSPTEERFLELYNDGDSAVDLTGWYMQRKTATGDSFGSLVSKPNFEGKTISAHDYFVISRVSMNNSDIVLGTLTLTESNTIQIKKSEAEVVDKVGWGDAADCGNPCPPNPGEGQSIQKTGTGLWIVSTSTPGASNSNQTSAFNDSNDNNYSNNDDNIGGANENNTNDNNDANAGDNADTDKSLIKENQKIKLKIIGKTLAFVGIPFSLQAQVSNYDGEQLSSGKYFWNFGDGDFKEVKDNMPFSRSYLYAGEYPVSLEYYANLDSNIPDATAKITIKVVPMAVSISRVGDEKDFFIELWNDTNYEIDLSNWLLSSFNKTFVLPKSSSILAKKKIIFSSKITNFSVYDKNSLKLMTPQGEVVFDYGASIVSTAVVPVKITVPSKAKVVSKTVEPVQKVALTEKVQTKIPVENLPAGVIESNVIENNPIRAYFFATILTVFLGMSAGAVYFVRRKKIIRGAGDDFKILDE